MALPNENRLFNVFMKNVMVWFVLHGDDLFNYTTCSLEITYIG